MKPETLDKLISIGDEILECKRCSLHKELAEQSIPYRPDAPIVFNRERPGFSAMSVGINPGWDDAFYQEHLKAIYREPDLNKCRVAVEENWKEQTRKKRIGRQPYRDGVYDTFNILNKELRIYNDFIPKKDIFDYVFWANLSFCGSQNPGKRVFDGKEVSSKVIQEEVPTCLRQGYLRKLIEAVEPKLIMFFGPEALNFFYFSKIFELSSYDKIIDNPKTHFLAHKRKTMDIEIMIFSSILQAGDKKTWLLFLPHPNYRFNSEYKTAALRDVCKWLTSTDHSPSE